MSGTLGNLSVILTLNDAGFTVGVQRASAAATTLKGAVDGLNSSIGKTGSTFSTAAGDATKWGQALSAASSSSTAALAQATAAIQRQTAASTASIAALQQQIAAITALTRAQTALSNVRPPASNGGLLFNTANAIQFAGSLLGVGTAAGVAVEAFKLISAAAEDVIADGDKMTASLNQLQAVSGANREQAVALYDGITSAAIRTGTATSDLAKTTIQLLTVLGPLGQTPAQVLRIAQTLSELQAISGTSAGGATRAIRELTEGLSQGEEQLRQMQIIARDDPALLTALAKAANTTAGGLMEMASAGKLTSAEMVNLLNTVGTNVDATFAKIPRTLEQSRTSMADSFAKLRADIDRSLGFSQTLAAWDRGWAAFAQGLDGLFDRTITPKLEKARADLASLQQIMADPQHRTAIGASEDTGDLARQIAQQQQYVAGLERQQQAQMATLDASARTNGEMTRQANVIDSAQKALDALGFSHGKAQSAAEALRAAIAAGGDALISYNGTLVSASSLLTRLADKAGPAATEIAKLNAALVQAQADAHGAFDGNLNKSLIAADAATSTSDTRAKLLSLSNQIAAVQGGKEVEESHKRVLLAQAASLGTLAEATERARQAREKFLQTYGNSPAVQKEADEVYQNDVRAARIQAATKSVKTAAQQQKPVDAFTTQLQEKIAGFKAAIDDADASEARFLERVKDTAALKGHSAVLDQLIAQYGAFKERAELATKAQDAVKKVGDITAIAQSAIGSFDFNTKLYRTDLQKEYYKNLQDINKEVSALHAAINGGAYSANPDGLANASQQLANAKGQLDTLNLASLLSQFDKLRQEVNTDRGFNKANGGQAAYAQLAGDQKELTDALNSAYGNGSLGGGQAALDKKKDLEQQLADWVKVKQNQIYSANKDQLAKTAEDWGNWQKMVGSDASSLFEQISGALQETGTKSKTAWANIGTSFAKMIDDMVFKLASSQIFSLLDKLWTGDSKTGSGSGGLSSLLSGAGSSVAKWLGLGSSAGGASTTQSAGEIAFVNAAGHHRGGLAGAEPTFMRSLPASLFETAPRYHTGGLAGDEIPAVLQQGEGVFTKGQMKALGAALAVPASAAKAASPPNYNYNLTGTPGSVGGNGSSSGNVVVNLHNQTGTPHNVVSSAPRWDADKMVIDIVTKAANQPGPFRTAIRGQ